MSKKLCDLRPGLATVRGWVEKITLFKKHSFIILRDGAGKESHIQVYISVEVAPPASLVVESYVEIEGAVRKLPKGAFSFRKFELEASKFTVIGSSDSDFPSQCPSDAGPDVKLEQRHLFVRDPKFVLVTKLRTALVNALRIHFEETECTEIFPPSFVG